MNHTFVMRSKGWEVYSDLNLGEFEELLDDIFEEFLINHIKIKIFQAGKIWIL